VKNLLMNGALTVTCPNPVAAPNCQSGVVISLQWNERNASHTGADTEPFTITLNAVL